MCAQCEDGYFNALNGCHRCLDRGVIVFLSVVLLVGWYVINVTVSRSVTSLEMMLGWAQLANIIGDINLNWTQNVTTMFGVANLLDFDVDILEPGCVIEWGFRANFVTQLLLPFVMSTMAASGYLLSAAVHLLIRSGRLKLDERTERLLSVFVAVSGDRERLREKWDATVATFLSAVDVTYVTIAKYCFDVFRCEEIAGVSVLRESPDVLCGDVYHLSLKLLSVLGIAFYVVGYLVYLLWKLYDLRTRCAFADATNLRRLGFVYQKFELDYYFTPAVIIVRKLLFVLVLVYVNNPAFQIGLLSIVINTSLMIQVYTAPYVDTYFDVLFSFLLVALMFEAFGGLMFYSENLPDDNRRILEWLVITSLLMLTVVFLVTLCMEIAKKFCMKYVKRAQVLYVKDDCRRSLKRETSAHRETSARSAFSQTYLRSMSSRTEHEISFELLETFRPSFVYNSIRKQPESIKEWNELSNKLKDYMSDQSDTAYLSMSPVAKFWRKLVDRFPELVDFLAVADDGTREKFKTIATSLFRDFYLTNKVTPLPLMDILNWRDRAPMAQWLAVAPPKHREFFLHVIAEMFENNENSEAAAILRSRLHKGRRRFDPLLENRRWVRRNRSISRILSSLSNGLSPFDHSAMFSIIHLPSRQTRPPSRGGRYRGTLEIMVQDERQRPIVAPMTPIPGSEKSLAHVSVSNSPTTEIRSSEAPDEICVETSSADESSSSAKDGSDNKQNNNRSLRSQNNNSTSLEAETDA